MSFLKKLFSSDHRAALAAEASGDFELAAQRYALAGEYDSAVRMHLARAERAKSRDLEIDALRDALHWSAQSLASRTKVKKALGRAMWAQAQAEGIQTHRDRQRALEAAQFLEAAECFREAGDAFTAMGDGARASEAYRKGGCVALLEETLDRESEAAERERTIQRNFADYEVHLQGGARDEAVGCLRTCVQASAGEGAAEYRRLLDELESRLITRGGVTITPRGALGVRFCSLPEVRLGRDAMCDLVLRTGGVSRTHALISMDMGQGGPTFEVMDAGSRNGTLVAGLAIAGRVSLRGEGVFTLGEEIGIAYKERRSPGHLRIEVVGGLDKGRRLVLAPEGTAMPFVENGDTWTVAFRNGRPLLFGGTQELLLNGQALKGSTVQLIHGDEFVVGGCDYEVT